MSAPYYTDPADANWKDDASFKRWEDFMAKYFPEGDKSSSFTVYGMAVAETLVQVLKQCGDDLTRENVMKQAASIKNLELGGLLPGIKVNTSASDFAPLSQVNLERFKGETWELFGEILNGDVGG